MALKSIEASGFTEVETVGEDFGIGILACVEYTGEVLLSFFFVVVVVDDDDDDDDDDGDADRKALASYGGYKRNLNPWLYS